MDYLALKTPGFGAITPPPNIPSGAGSAGLAITAFLNLFIILGIVAALGFCVYGGILWITSGGDKGKVDRARRTITYAIVGLIVIIMSYTIIRIVGAIIGSQFLERF